MRCLARSHDIPGVDERRELPALSEVHLVNATASGRLPQKRRRPHAHAYPHAPSLATADSFLLWPCGFVRRCRCCRCRRRLPAAGRRTDESHLAARPKPRRPRPRHVAPAAGARAAQSSANALVQVARVCSFRMRLPLCSALLSTAKHPQGGCPCCQEPYWHLFRLQPATASGALYAAMLERTALWHARFAMARRAICPSTFISPLRSLCARSAASASRSGARALTPTSSRRLSMLPTGKFVSI
eukprot:6205350-Pleurochrysis_carterae.AAC.1